MKGLLGRARFAALGLVLALAGCVTTENSLSQSDIANTSAAMPRPPPIRIRCTADAIAKLFTTRIRRKVRPYVLGLLGPRIKAGVEQAMAGGLVGTRPVRLELVDARTGAVIIAYPNLSAIVPTGQGIVGTAVQAAIDNASAQSPAEKLIALYGQNYRDWLLRSRGGA